MSETEVEPDPVTDPAPDDEEGEPEPAPPDETEELGQASEAPVAGPVQQAGAADESDPRIIESQKKWVNFQKALRSIWGEYEKNLMDCPLCFESHKGLIDIQDAGSYPEDILAAITEYARGSAQVEYRQASQVRECDHCAGYGKVKSGSRVASHELVTCTACKGYGYVPPPVPSSNGYAEVAQVDPGNMGSEEVEPPSDADIWGSPRLLPDGQENPNYGKMPQYKVPTLP